MSSSPKPRITSAYGEEAVIDIIKTSITRNAIFGNRPPLTTNKEFIAFFPVTVSDVVNLNTEYKIRLTGVLETGKKTTIYLTGFVPFVDVVHDDDGKMDDDSLYTLSEAIRMESLSRRFIKTAANSKDGRVTRLFFKNLVTREDAIVNLRTRYTLASNELYQYYEVVARHHPNIKYSNWIYIPTNGFPNIPVHKVEPVPPMNEDDKYRLSDVLLTATWDIETWNPKNDANEDGTSSDSVVHTICSTLHNYRSTSTIAAVVFSLSDVDEAVYEKLLLADSNKGSPVSDDAVHHYIFTLHSQSELIRCFIAYLDLAEPDFIVGFNDSFYDWKFIRSKIALLGLFDYADRKARVYFRNVNVKIPGNNDGTRNEEAGTVLSKPGLVPIDARTRYRIIYPKDSRSSLTHFLSKINDLTGSEQKKVDLPYATMYKYYLELLTDGPSEKTSENFASVAFYCLMDAFLCQHLLVHDATIDYYRAFVDGPRMSLYSAHYNADSSKITNLVCIEAFRRNVVIQHNHKLRGERNATETRKLKNYQGGYVQEPIAGVNKTVPVFALDYTSLYPSEIIANNISIDTLVDETYEGETHDAHVSDTETYRFRAHGQNIENYGIVPRVLMTLIEKRLVVKRELGRLGKEIDRLVAEGADPDLIRKMKELYVVKNLEQLVTKRFANSVYGSLGATWHPLYHKGLASSVTFFGRRDLRRAIDFVTSLGYTVSYGDTDSMYIALKDSHVETVKAEMQMASDPPQQVALMYYSNLVKKAFKVAIELQNEVNEYMFQCYGHRTLTMEYEEVLFPVVFCQKKNYFGLCHKSSVSLTVAPDYSNVFARGIQIVQRVTSTVTADFNKFFISRILSVTTEETIMDTFLYTVDWFISTYRTRAISDFYLNKAYRPYRDVKDVNSFINRIKQTRPGAPIPIPGERFEFILVNRPILTERGTKNNLKIGDLMEYPDVAKSIDDINVPMYILRSISTISKILFCSGQGAATAERTTTLLNNIIKEKCNAAGLSIYTSSLAKMEKMATRKKTSVSVHLNGARLTGFPTAKLRLFWMSRSLDRIDAWLRVNARFESASIDSITREIFSSKVPMRLKTFPEEAVQSLSKWTASLLIKELYMVDMYKIVKRVQEEKYDDLII